MPRGAAIFSVDDSPRSLRRDDAPIWTPPGDDRIAVSTPAVATAYEAALLEILDSASCPGETIARAFERKELELRAALARLTVAEARALHRRFQVAACGDILIERFTRLAVDRRLRLIAFLADAPRRAALALAKRGAR